jgi:hypothetical protein
MSSLALAKGEIALFRFCDPSEIFKLAWTLAAIDDVGALARIIASSSSTLLSSLERIISKRPSTMSVCDLKSSSLRLPAILRL